MLRLSAFTQNVSLVICLPACGATVASNFEALCEEWRRMARESYYILRKKVGELVWSTNYARMDYRTKD